MSDQSDQSDQLEIIEFFPSDMWSGVSDQSDQIPAGVPERLAEGAVSMAARVRPRLKGAHLVRLEALLRRPPCRARPRQDDFERAKGAALAAILALKDHPVRLPVWAAPPPPRRGVAKARGRTRGSGYHRERQALFAALAAVADRPLPLYRNRASEHQMSLCDAIAWAMREASLREDRFCGLTTYRAVEEEVRLVMREGRKVREAMLQLKQAMLAFR